MIKNFLRRIFNLTTIEWLDANWTRALVTEHRLFKPDLFTEAVLQEKKRSDTTVEVWHHVDSDIPLSGESGWVWHSFVFDAKGLQKALSKARLKNINKLRRKETKRIQNIVKAEERNAWLERPRLPAAKANQRKSDNG